MKRSTNDVVPATARTKAPTTSWRDHLCLLLHVGAEIEHALMVEYLYAAYSLGGAQVPPEHRASVQRWQNTLLTVAREEMGHLATVQNVLTLVGGAVSFERSDYPFDTPYYPFPLRLGPLTLDSIARYVYAEKPLRMPADALPKEKRVAAAATKRVEGEVRHPHPVAKIYEQIIEIIGDPTRIPDSTFDPGSYARQASWEEWGKGYRPEVGMTNPVLAEERRAGYGTDDLPKSERRATVIVAQMATRTEAVAGLRQIAGQGEAPHLTDVARDGREPSHFERFVDVYEGIERAKGWKPVRDVPVNPTTRTEGGSTKERTVIESKTSRAWADLFNLRYRMALTSLTHIFRLAGDTAGPGRRLRGPTLHRIFGEMYNLKTIAGILVRSPLTDDRRDARRAGPPFEMPYTLALPTTDVDCWLLHRELLQGSLHVAEALSHEATADAARYLATLRELDRQAVAWIDQVLAGLGAGRRGVTS